MRRLTEIGFALVAICALAVLVNVDRPVYSQSPQRIYGTLTTGAAIPIQATAAGLLKVQNNGLFTAGGGTATACADGTVDSQFTAVGNVGTGEDDLMTYSLPAGTLSANGYGVRIRAWFSGAANTNSKIFKLYFGSTAVITRTSSGNNLGYWFEVVVSRMTAITHTAAAFMLDEGGDRDVEVNASLTADTAATIVIKATAEATANNDIVQRGLVVTFFCKPS